jgi:hypothetical protein
MVSFFWEMAWLTLLLKLYSVPTSEPGHMELRALRLTSNRNHNYDRYKSNDQSQ